jgi:hypothetical protein
MDKWNHKSIEISITDKGAFKASVSGIDIEKPTLEACKTQIDNLLKKNATRPKVLYQDYHGWRIGEVTSAAGKTNDFWITDEGGRRGKYYTSHIFKYNEKIANRIREIDKIKADIQEELDEMDHKLINYHKEELMKELGLTEE